MKNKLIITGIVFGLILLVSITALSLSTTASWVLFVTGQKTVTSKGTPVQLPSVTLEGDIVLIMKAMNDNTGIIYVGYSSATALNSGSSYFSLYPGESVGLNIVNANKIWIDGESGEGIEYITEDN